MKISVFMTVKNGQWFIHRALNSILSQTLLPSEIIVVDDGSSDNTIATLEPLVKNSVVPIKLIETGGIGRAKALNIAVENCSFDWIANLDVDDFWLPRKLECQAQLIEQIPEARVVVTKSKILFKDEYLEDSSNSTIEAFYTKLTKASFYSTNPINHSSIIIQKNLFFKVNGYEIKLNKQIDYDLWVRLILEIDHIYQINEPLTVKYLHSEQSFESKNVFVYRLHALKINLLMLGKLNAPLKIYVRPFVFFVLGFLPRKLKRSLRKFK